MSENEIGGGFDAINTGWESSDSGEVSQEDLIRVNESLGEAKRVRGQISWSIASNTKIAQFIHYLVMQIADNSFWDALDCFWVRKDLGEPYFLSHTFVACMLPLYEEKADELWLNKEFPLDYHILVNFQNYILYVQQVFAHDKESWMVDEKKLIGFLKVVLKLRAIPLSEQDSLEGLQIPSLSSQL